MPRAIYALMLASFAVGTQGFVFGGLLAELAADLGVSVGTAGLTVAAGAVTFALGAPAAAILLARQDRRHMLAGGLALIALANLGSALAPEIVSLVALRVLSGAGAAMVGAVNAAVAVALSPPERRGRALALVVGGVTLAFVLGLPLGSAVGGAYGWRACFVLAAIIGAIACIAMLVALPALPTGPGPRPSPSALLRLPPVVAGLATSLLAYTATFCVVAFTGPLVNQVAGVAGAAVGSYQVFIGLGSFAGLALGGRAIDRGRSAQALVLAVGSAMGTGLWFAALLDGWGGFAAGWLLRAAILVSAAALFAIIPLVQARLASVAGAATPLALALNGSCVSLGQGLGAAVGGAAGSLTAAALAGTAIAALATVAALRVHRDRPVAG